MPLPDAWGPMSFRRVVVDVFLGLIKSVGVGLSVQNTLPVDPFQKDGLFVSV